MTSTIYEVPGKYHVRLGPGASSTHRPSSLKLLSEEFIRPGGKLKKSTWYIFIKYVTSGSGPLTRNITVLTADKLLCRPKFLYSTGLAGEKFSEVIWMRCSPRLGST